MNKRIISIILCASIILSSCGSDNTNKENTNNTPIQKTEEKEVSYSSAFSQEDLIYFILTDRFFDGDKTINTSGTNIDDPLAYHGGDLQGIIDKLDYIKSLGSTAIWITPVVDNEDRGYHGYWTKDFYSVDENLGTLEKLKELVSEAHKRDIKVLLDQVVNHTGYKSPWLKDDSKSAWFHPNQSITNWNDQKQVENGWLAGLPDLNQSNPEVSKYLIDNTLWWIKETGVDGMRLDTVKHVSKDFWKEYTSAVKEKYPDFYFLGEVWSDNTRYLESYHELGIDGVTDYSLYKGIREAFGRFGKTGKLVSAIKSGKYFSKKDLNGIFIDNHDNSRLISSAGDHGVESLKQSLAFIMTYPSIPILYYGTEIGLEGDNDPDNRRDMPWNLINNNDVLDYFKTLSSLRKSSKWVESNELQLLSYDSKYISYRRGTKEDGIIVILNLLGKEKPVEVQLDESNAKYVDQLSNKEFVSEENILKINLKPYDILILQK